MALAMYLEGLGFNSIGRLLHVSHVAVQKWIMQYGSGIEPIRRTEDIKAMKLDELHTYIGRKKLLLGMDCC